MILNNYKIHLQYQVITSQESLVSKLKNRNSVDLTLTSTPIMLQPPKDPQKTITKQS